MQPIRLILVLPLLLAAVPAKAQEPVPTMRPGEPDAYTIPRGDPRMQAATERARATLPVFDTYLERAARGEVVARVTVTFTREGRREHMWVWDVTRENGHYRGTLENSPILVTSLARGDTITFTADRVADWMVVEDGQLIGGFAMLELRRRMNDKERAAFDRAKGYRMPADTAIWNVPHPRH